MQWKQAKPCDRRYPPIVWKAFVSDITSHCKPTITTSGTDLTVCGKQWPELIKTVGSVNPVSFANTDHVRHGDETILDVNNEVMTRPVRTKYIPKSIPTVTSAFPLQPKKNRKGKKKPIEWPDDPEMKAQGQDAVCGENLKSLDESALMDCEFRDDALGSKKDK